MITTLKDSRGYVYAYVEWWICNVNGFIEENGKYCQVRNMWIHGSHRQSVFNPHKKTFWEIILKMDKDPLMQSADKVYWRRRKYDRQSKLYSRERIVEKGVRNGRKQNRYTASTSTAAA